MEIQAIKVIITALQKFINDNAKPVPQVQLEFITKQTIPAAYIKAGVITPVKEYIAGAGVYSLSFYLVYKTQSQGDKEKVFKWLGAATLFFEQVSKPTIFRLPDFKNLPSITTMDIGEGLKAKEVKEAQSPTDVSGQDTDGNVWYQSILSLRFHKKGDI